MHFIIEVLNACKCCFYTEKVETFHLAKEKKKARMCDGGNLLLILASPGGIVPGICLCEKRACSLRGLQSLCKPLHPTRPRSGAALALLPDPFWSFSVLRSCPATTRGLLLTGLRSLIAPWDEVRQTACRWADEILHTCVVCASCENSSIRGGLIGDSHRWVKDFTHWKLLQVSAQKDKEHQGNGLISTLDIEASVLQPET